MSEKTRLEKGLRWLHGHDSRYLTALGLLSQRSYTRPELRKRLGIQDEQIARVVRYLQRYGFVESFADLSSSHSETDVFQATRLGREAFEIVDRQMQVADQTNYAAALRMRYKSVAALGAIVALHRRAENAVPSDVLHVKFGKVTRITGTSTAATISASLEVR